MNYLRQGFQKLSYYKHTDRQTYGRMPPETLPRRFVVVKRNKNMISITDRG